MLHDAAWALPMNPHSLEQFQWLAAEIADLGGDSLLWEARLAVGKQDEALVRVLLAQLESAQGETPIEVE